MLIVKVKFYNDFIDCCTSEGMLWNLQSWMQENEYKKDIPIVRVDSKTQQQELANEELLASAQPSIKLYHSKFFTNFR